MKKITTIALATMIVSSLSVMPALAADIFSDDSGSALAAGKNWLRPKILLSLLRKPPALRLAVS